MARVGLLLNTHDRNTFCAPNPICWHSSMWRYEGVSYGLVLLVFLSFILWSAIWCTCNGRQAVEAWGLKLCTKRPEWKSDTVTAVEVPSWLDSGDIVKIAWKKYNLSLGVGLNKVAGKIFRIGHLGNLNEVHIDLICWDSFIDKLNYALFVSDQVEEGHLLAWKHLSGSSLQKLCSCLCHRELPRLFSLVSLL